MAISKPSSVEGLFPDWNLDGGPAPSEKPSAEGIFPWLDFTYTSQEVTPPGSVDELFGDGFGAGKLDWKFDKPPVPASAKDIFPYVDFAYKDAVPTSRTLNEAEQLYNREKMQEIMDQDTPDIRLSDGFRNTYTSFSGADISVSIVPKGSNAKPVTLGEMQTVSYSIYREKKPVYALGSARPRGFVKGPRMIAGSMIFTVFDRHVMQAAMMEAYKGTDKDKNCMGTTLPDDYPPFDFHINFLNEYGQSAMMIIYGVQLVSEGQTMSIEDIMTESTMQYMAENIRLMTPDAYEKTEYGYKPYSAKKKKK